MLESLSLSNGEEYCIVKQDHLKQTAWTTNTPFSPDLIDSPVIYPNSNVLRR